MQTTRDALMDEVAYLGDKTASLEEALRATGVGSGGDSIEGGMSINELRQQNELLLTLLGEKEEELEAAISDIKDIKGLYQDQIAALLERIAPPATTAET